MIIVNKKIIIIYERIASIHRLTNTLFKYTIIDCHKALEGKFTILEVDYHFRKNIFNNPFI